jgi:hypothetical protein
MESYHDLFLAFESVLYGLTDVRDWDAPKWQDVEDLKDFLDEMAAVTPGRLKSEIEAANCLHASTTGPVRDGEFYGASWLEVAATIIDFVWYCIYDSYPDPIEIHKALKEAFKSLPTFDPGWLCMVVKHDCELLAHGKKIDAKEPPLSDFQRRILSSLDGEGLTKEQLCEALNCDGKKLYRRHGIRELVYRGMVKNKRTIGYYRHSPI